MSNEAQGVDRRDAKVFGIVNMSSQLQIDEQPEMVIINHNNRNHVVVPSTIRYAPTFSCHAHSNIALSSGLFTKFVLVVNNARIPDERHEINRMDKKVHDPFIICGCQCG